MDIQELYFGAFPDNATSFIAALETKGELLSVTSSVLNVLGYGSGELSGTSFIDLVHPDDSASFIEALGNVMRISPSPLVLRLRHKDGTWRYTENTIKFLDRPDFAPYIIHSTDITGYKQLEQSLLESEDRFRTITDGSIVGIYAIQEGIIVYANPKLAEIYGYEVSEMIGMRWEQVIYPEDIPLVRENIRRREMGETESIHYEFRGLRKNREIIYIDVYGGRTTFRGKSTAVGTQLDITDRKMIEEALRKSEERYRLITENMTDMVLVIDPSSMKLTYASPSTIKNLGISPEEALKKDPGKSISKAALEELSKIIGEFMEDVVAGSPCGVRHQEWEYTCENGSSKWFEACYSPVIDSAGILISVQGSHRDITDRKKIQQELERKTEELIRSNNDLEQFSYIVSHDLQEPLRMITSYMELLSKRYKESLDESAGEFIHFAVDGAKRMKQLINDLLAYSRVGTRGRSFEMINVQEVFNDVVQNLRLTMEENGATVTSGLLPYLMGDRVQIGQLLQNLIGNAIKFHRDEPPRIHVSAAMQEDEWIFTVKDNGIGIEPQFQICVFDIFRRLHNKKDYEGTGIGLAVCKKIVERHGGHIRVESEPGKGSTFIFHLPRLIDKQE